MGQIGRQDVCGELCGDALIVQRRRVIFLIECPRSIAFTAPFIIEIIEHSRISRKINGERNA